MTDELPIDRRQALAQADRAAYVKEPEEVDSFWRKADAWSAEPHPIESRA